MDKTCFIVCPIGNEGSETRKNSDKLLKHILKPVCDKNGFDCVRVDELNDSNSLTDTIINYLTKSDLVIADLTGHNPNAFFELGYRTAIGKNTIHLKQKNDKIPFDISTIRTFNYDLTDLDSVEEVKDRIDKTIQNMKFNTSSTVELIKDETNSEQVFYELFKIQDKLDNIIKALEQNNSTAISVLADKLYNVPKSPQEVLIESLFKNPKSLFELAEISKEIQNQSSEDNSENIDESTS